MEMWICLLCVAEGSRCKEARTLPAQSNEQMHKLMFHQVASQRLYRLPTQPFFQAGVDFFKEELTLCHGHILVNLCVRDQPAELIGRQFVEIVLAAHEGVEAEGDLEGGRMPAQRAHYALRAKGGTKARRGAEGGYVGCV